MIEILDVSTKTLKKEFVDFQYKLYENCPQFVPPVQIRHFYDDEQKETPVL